MLASVCKRWRTLLANVGVSCIIVLLFPWFFHVLLQGIAATTILKPNGNIHVCEGDIVTLYCNDSDRIIEWKWSANSTMQTVIYTILDNDMRDTSGIITQKVDEFSSNLTFRYSLSKFLPSKIHCNVEYINIFLREKLNPDMFSIMNFNPQRWNSSFDLIIGNTSISNVTILLSSRGESNYIVNNNYSITININYNQTYLISFLTEVCDETTTVNGSVIVQNSSADSAFVLRLQFNHTNYTYEYPYEKFTSSIIVPDSNTNSTSGIAKTEGMTTKCDMTGAISDFTILDMSRNMITYQCLNSSESTTFMSSCIDGQWKPHPEENNCTTYTIGSLNIAIAIISAVLSIGIILIAISLVAFLIKKQKCVSVKGSKKPRNSDEYQDDVEYNKIDRTRIQLNVDNGEYGKLNSTQTHRVALYQEEEYSHINTMECNTVCDDMYDSIKGSASQNTKADVKKKSDPPVFKYSKVRFEANDADKLLNLDTMLIQLRSVSVKWKEFGLQLKFTSTQLLQFESLSDGTDFGAFTELCDNWLRDTMNPTWIILATALRNIDEEQLSEEVLHIYKTGTLTERKDSFYFEKYDEAPPIPPQNF